MTRTPFQPPRAPRSERLRLQGRLLVLLGMRSELLAIGAPSARRERNDREILIARRRLSALAGT